MNKTLVILLGLSVTLAFVNAHGYLDNPPARSSAWRHDSRFPPWWNDMSLYCEDVNARCGICGESYDAPKQLEKGGSFYRGWIVRTYSNKDIIEATIQITANHAGAFEFRLCDVSKTPNGEATDECLNKLLLKDLSGNTFIMNPYQDYNTNRPVTIKLRIPDGFTCEHCVFQWRWYTEHQCGGRPFLQCNYKSLQTFNGCSDIKITGDGSPSIPATQDPITISTPKPTTKPVDPTGPLAEVWQQCGGLNWSGATACLPGSVCTVQNEWYSQCLPVIG